MVIDTFVGQRFCLHFPFIQIGNVQAAQVAAFRMDQYHIIFQGMLVLRAVVRVGAEL